jgi:hypothetical protein
LVKTGAGLLPRLAKISVLIIVPAARQKNGRQKNGGQENGRQENGRQENMK